MMNLAYSAIYTITPESFSTEIRNLGVGLANICARIGGISAPIVTGIMLGSANGFKIAVSLFAVLYGICSFVTLFLRETRISTKEEPLVFSIKD
jgi:nitrate/nitrite transporter NarK